MKGAAALLLAVSAAAAQEVVFRSDVSLVRVDAQVLDRNHRAITGLEAEDFVLREAGQPQQIRNFAREEVPVDILLLLDVSGSMRTHVERIAAAAEDAMRVLGAEDRVAVMVFDRATRVRLPFQRSRSEIERGLDSVLQQETFNGGTDITKALLDAAAYVSRHARPEARRAIVIVTDDQTERDRDQARVGRALINADAVLSALIAPDAIGRRGGWPTWPSTGGTLPDIILRRRGGRFPGPVSSSRTQSAGTPEIARESGGDSLPVDDAQALETTFSRIRHRYALHFNLPEGVAPGQERAIEVELSPAALRRYPNAEVRYRRVYFTPSAGSGEPPTVVSQTTTAPERTAEPRAEPVPTPSSTAPRTGGWRRADEAPGKGGWRRVRPGEEP